MAATVTLNHALEVFGKLSAEDRDLMLEIAKKRQIETWRADTAAYGRKAVADAKAGKLKGYTAEELAKRLREQWDAIDD